MTFQINEELLSHIATLYGINSEELTYKGGFGNQFYSYSLNNKEYMIRIKSEGNVEFRSYNQVVAESDWILYLDRNGVQVSKPQLSINNNYVEQLIVNEKKYLINSFDKAQGTYIVDLKPEERNKFLWEKLGEIVGKIHQLSMKFVPREEYKRKEFEEDSFLNYAQFLDPEKEKDIINVYDSLIMWLSTLNKPKTEYGMIHGDLNWGNYFIHNNVVTLFDFDSSCYNWFIYEIAILVYSLIWEDTIDHVKNFLKSFIPPFYKGYLKFHSLDREWLELMPDFLNFHDFFLYSALSETVNAGNTTEDYAGMLEIIKKRCRSQVSKQYCTKDEWLKLFMN